MYFIGSSCSTPSGVVEIDGGSRSCSSSSSSSSEIQDLIEYYAYTRVHIARNSLGSTVYLVANLGLCRKIPPAEIMKIRKRAQSPTTWMGFGFVLDRCRVDEFATAARRELTSSSEVLSSIACTHAISKGAAARAFYRWKKAAGSSIDDGDGGGVCIANGGVSGGGVSGGGDGGDGSGSYVEIFPASTVAVWEKAKSKSKQEKPSNLMLSLFLPLFLSFSCPSLSLSLLRSFSFFIFLFLLFFYVLLLPFSHPLFLSVSLCFSLSLVFNGNATTSQQKAPASTQRFSHTMPTTPHLLPFRGTLESVPMDAATSSQSYSR
ncbi:hypothetical protein M0802_013887 [Mischocyttarus mexicanus]|nr:hypothetical protein M0802_013887 [Mischocyttarus mexicanus]